VTRLGLGPSRLRLRIARALHRAVQHQGGPCCTGRVSRPALTSIVKVMSDEPYRWTSGRMLHIERCEHFYEDQPPRLATPEEKVALPVCNSCAGRSRSHGRRSSGAMGAETFVCQSCYVIHPIAVRSGDGRCYVCAD
jgi:hypothetical protein